MSCAADFGDLLDRETRLELLRLNEIINNKLQQIQSRLDNALTSENRFPIHEHDASNINDVLEAEVCRDDLLVDEPEVIDDIEATYEAQYEDTQPEEFESMTTSQQIEECDPFWIAICADATEAREHLRLKILVSICEHVLLLDPTIVRHSKLLIFGGCFIVKKTMVRDYDGFNGPGVFQSQLALVRDYDGFNGPGYLEVMVVKRGGYCHVMYSMGPYWSYKEM